MVLLAGFDYRRQITDADAGVGCSILRLLLVSTPYDVHMHIVVPSAPEPHLLVLCQSVMSLSE